MSEYVSKLIDRIKESKGCRFQYKQKGETRHAEASHGKVREQREEGRALII